MLMKNVPESALSKALTSLYSRTAFGIKPGLEIVQALLARSGNPERAVPCIHVAGTNGKGSVCAMLEVTLRAAGLKTGMYTSPHLVRFNERFRIDGECIADDELETLLDVMEKNAKALESKQHLRPATFFEISTALAFEYFQRSEVDVAVIETGMGGLWDATNVVTPIVSVLTRIGIDHTDYLGDSIEQIASEKCGIMKPGRPAVCAPMSEDVRAVAEDYSAQIGAALVMAEDLVSVQRVDVDSSGRQKVRVEMDDLGCSLFLPLPGRHQVENLGVALATLEILNRVGFVDLNTDLLKQGLNSLKWPGRCQLLTDDPPVYIDAAHNPSGARVLAVVLKELANGRPVALVAGFLADKDAVGILRALSGITRRLGIAT